MYSRSEQIRSIRYKWIAMIFTLIIHFVLFFVLHKAMDRHDSAQPPDKEATAYHELLPSLKQTVKLT